MGLKDDLARVLARDARFEYEAYLLVLQAFDHVRRSQNRQARKRQETAPGAPGAARKGASRRAAFHIPGRRLCLGVRALALRQYGDLALPLLRQWGLHTTSDIGAIVFNLIDSGDLEASPRDKRSDFDHVYDFEETMGPNRRLERRESDDRE
jgi:uncharacterized repeat protein (TIGR04138 family)